MESNIPSSFRDVGGFVYKKNGVVFRKILKHSIDDYFHLMNSGLYDFLAKKSSLVRHTEVGSKSHKERKIPVNSIEIKPEQIQCITYPYEWCFNQLKDASLLTLQICVDAINHGMILKDANAYNIQFIGSKPILIDTCSFTKYVEGEPWVAYQQFCRHFLAPLLLMSKVDIRFGLLSKIHIDGMPLDLTSKILPKSSWLFPSVLAHVHLHAKSQSKYADATDLRKRTISKIGLLGILKSLQKLIKKTNWKESSTEWGDYYNFTNYSEDSANHKSLVVADMINQIQPLNVLDIGSNDGRYSRIAAKSGAFVLSADIDPIAVEKNYQKAKNNKEFNIVPIIQDMTNPSSSIGWAHSERDSLQSRGVFDSVMALALIHHLAISNNVPFNMIAKYFSKLGKNLIIEFVPKTDSQVRKLLSSREDIFNNYSEVFFEKEFSKFFKILQKTHIRESNRIIFLMQRKH